MEELAIFFFSIYSSPQPFMRDNINQLRATTYPIWTGAFLTPGRTRKGDEHCRTAAGQGYSERFGGWIKFEDISPHAFYFIVSHITLFFPSFPLFFYSLYNITFWFWSGRGYFIFLSFTPLMHFPIHTPLTHSHTTCFLFLLSPPVHSVSHLIITTLHER